MGEQGAFKGAKPGLSDESQTGGKIAEFGRNLFKQGKSLAEGLENRVQEMDVKGIGQRAQERLKSIDTSKMAAQAKNALNGVDTEQLAGAAGIAGKLAFPQLAILDRGSSEIGDLLARKQARVMLEDQQKLSDKLISSFDELDKDKSGYLDDAKLRSNDGLTGIASDKRALSLILRSGYTSFNSLDGDSSKKGISRLDIQTFALMQDKDLLADYVSKNSNRQALGWGVAGAGAGAAFTHIKHAGMNFSLEALRSTPAGRLALAATLGAVLLGGAAKLVSRHRQDGFYEEKETEIKKLMSSMKNSF